MKRFIVFTISFILLFGVLQVLSGLLLTLIYTPDISGAWKGASNLPQHIEIVEGPSIPMFLIGIFSAIVAFFVPKFLVKKK